MWLVAQGGHRIVFLTQRRNAPWIDGVMTVVYKSHHRPGAGAYGLSKVREAAHRRGVRRRHGCPRDGEERGLPARPDPGPYRLG